MARRRVAHGAERPFSSPRHEWPPGAPYGRALPAVQWRVARAPHYTAPGRGRQRKHGTGDSDRLHHLSVTGTRAQMYRKPPCAAGGSAVWYNKATTQGWMTRARCDIGQAAMLMAGWERRPRPCARLTTRCPALKPEATPPAVREFLPFPASPAPGRLARATRVALERQQERIQQVPMAISTTKGSCGN